MICVKRKYKGLMWREIHWVNERKQELEDADIVEYRYVPFEISSSTLVQVTTIVNDLTQEKDILWNSISKNGRYEIRRSEKENTQCNMIIEEFGEELNNVICFYNEFTQSKNNVNLAIVDKRKVDAYIQDNAFAYSIARISDKIVAVHFYIKDGNRAKLWLSGSLFRNSSSNEDRSSIGRANRLLHWHDMCWFKDNQYRTYDWGGVSEEEGVKSIGEFKKGFGGMAETGNNIMFPCSLKGKIAYKLINIKWKIKKAKYLNRS